MDIRDVRLQRLELLLAEQKAPRKTELARLLNRSPSQISQWLSRHRTISEDSARDIEKKGGKPRGWLDIVVAATPSAAAVQARENLEVAKRFEAQQVRAAIEQALAVVLKRIELLPPEVRAAVGHNLDGWARAGGAEPYHQIVLMLLTGGTAPRPPA